MNTHYIVAAITLVFASVGNVAPALSVDSRPNVLVIMVDDMGYSDLGCYGSENQHFKLYRDGTLYAVADRHETTPIRAGNGSQGAEDARKLLQRAIDSMPDKAAKLSVKIKQND